MRLENPDENPCFGCGPRHARGLRLAPERVRAADGVDEVVVTHVPKADEIGWPGLFHTGLHFTTLFETAYWAALELTTRVHVATGAQTFDQRRLPRVGVPFTAHARIVARDADGVSVRVESRTAEGKPCATLESRFRPESRARVEKSGLALPAYLLDDMAP